MLDFGALDSAGIVGADFGGGDPFLVGLSLGACCLPEISLLSPSASADFGSYTRLELEVSILRAPPPPPLPPPISPDYAIIRGSFWRVVARAQAGCTKRRGV